MASGRDAIVGRFRASALDRLRRIASTLIALEAGEGKVADVQAAARELHTIKGESRMLGMTPISEVTHRAETLLLQQHAPGEELPSPEAAATVGEALDVVGRALRGELDDADAVLERTSQSLDAAIAAFGDVVQPAASRTAAAPSPSADAAEASAPASAERWVQVSALKIDELCDRIAQFSADFRVLNARLHTRAADRALVEDFDRCRAQLDDLASASWALRMVPVEPTFHDLLRHARELAAAQHKRLRVTVETAGAQVERLVLDQLWDGLLHVVRNAIDHGIEPPAERGGKPPEASLVLRAEPVGASVVFTISDDGRGVDPDKVRAAAVARGRLRGVEAAALSDADALELLFEHGFSTRADVGELSGRGVGLDVVRAVVEGLGGAVGLSSRPGAGTQLRISIPTRLSVERALVVKCGDALYGIPSRYVEEVVRTGEHRVEAVVGGEVLRHRETAIPLRSLSSLLGQPAADEAWALLLHAGERRWALTVPSLVGEHELVRQPIDRLLLGLDYLGASATLDDGRLVLIVAVAGLWRRAERRSVQAAVAPRLSRKPRALVVDDSAVIRDLVVQILREGGLEVSMAADGQSALAIIDSDPPDVVISDIEMPVMNGFDLLAGIRQRSQKLPVIMLTSRGSTEDRRRAAALGANAHIVKSGFGEDTLLETIRRFVDLPRA